VETKNALLAAEIHLLPGRRLLVDCGEWMVDRKTATRLRSINSPLSTIHFYLSTFHSVASPLIFRPGLAASRARNPAVRDRHCRRARRVRNFHRRRCGRTPWFRGNCCLPPNDRQTWNRTRESCVRKFCPALHPRRDQRRPRSRSAGPKRDPALRDQHFAAIKSDGVT